MRVTRAILKKYRSVDDLEFELGPFTVLFGKNDAGKTNILEAIYGVLAPQDVPNRATGMLGHRSIRGAEDLLPSWGAVHAVLEPGLPFDDAVAAAVAGAQPVDPAACPYRRLPPNEIWFGNAEADQPCTLWTVDVHEFFEDISDPYVVILSEEVGMSPQVTEPRPLPLFIGWELGATDEWVTSVIADLTAVEDLNVWARQRMWLEQPSAGQTDGLRIRPAILERINQLSVLATALLPDFIDGAIRAEFSVPSDWERAPLVSVGFQARGEERVRAIGDFGRGTSRWMEIAVHVALHIMADPRLTIRAATGDLTFSGHVFFLDEPEAHLHPSAVASVVRWCERLVHSGCTLLAASHHEEFLRASSEGVRFVKVSHDGAPSSTRARTLLGKNTPLLQELAEEVGMHPAAVLSLHRAVLFVEGPLDEAVLDEFAGPALDAAGVTIIPIHGTKNLEGLIDGEFTTRLGIKVGVLTDNTITETMRDRSNRKRSSEEVKLIRLIQRFRDKGLPEPDLFGVPEDDLLFALPSDAIAAYLRGPFPDWLDLREQCRKAEGAGPSDSVDWKSFAMSQYGLGITTANGVRALVHALDLAGVELPSIKAAVDKIIAWAD